jgi:putative oxidoreductase
MVLPTESTLAPFAARVILGAVLFVHGAQHALGWFGGYGFGPTLKWMTGTLGIASWLAALAIIIELVAPVALLLGIGSRVAALSLVAFMIGAARVHVGNGFFMNWFGSLPAGVEGFEYHILAVALALVVVFAGGGKFSVDRLLSTGRTTGR